MSDDRQGAGSWSWLVPPLTAVFLRCLLPTITFVSLAKNFDGRARVLWLGLAIVVFAFAVSREIRRGEPRDMDA